MNKLIITIILSLLLTSLFSETIILQNGKEISGEIIAKMDDVIYLKVGDTIEQLKFSQIKSIRNDGYQPITKLWIKHANFKNDSIDLTNINTSYMEEEDIVLTNDLNKFTINEEKKYKTRLNWAHFVTGVTFGYFAYLKFDAIQDVDESIDDMAHIMNMNENQIKYQKEIIEESNKSCIKYGIIYSITSIINVAYSFEKVEIEISPSSAEISYKF